MGSADTILNEITILRCTKRRHLGQKADISMPSLLLSIAVFPRLRSDDGERMTGELLDKMMRESI